MNLTQFFLGLIILITSWQCGEAATTTTFHNRLTNRKQKKLIERSLDLKADACDDFYKYACGNWDQVFLEAGSKYYQPITMLDYNVNQEMSHVFNHFNVRNQPKFIREAYNYYKSCKDLERYEAIKYLVWLKANDGFHWPALLTKPKNNTRFDWVKTLGKMRIYGLNDVFIQIVMAKINDPKIYILDLDKPVADGGFKPLTKLQLEILMLSLPAQMTVAEFNNLWQEIEEFEEKLQDLDAIDDVEVETEIDYERESLFHVKNLPLDWLKDYVKVVLNQTALENEMQLYLQNISYMMALDQLLKQYTQRFLCKYLEIRFLWHLYIKGPANFKDEDCLSSTRSLMPMAMNWLYERKHPELQDEYSSIYEIFNDIRKHFNTTVTKNKYGFNATVIQYLQNKINQMKLRLNNIPRNDTNEILEKFYHYLNLDIEKFYENNLKLLRFNFQARLKLLSAETTILDCTYLENYEMDASSGPYFVQNANTVFVPLTLLQQPIYSPGLDVVYKYSSLGFILAHEMFHGFDDSRLLTDANGSLSLIRFEENPLFNASLNCLLEINPDVISEKIADISGLRYAYQAYFDSDPQASTKIINFYGSQIPVSRLFFLNFAQFFCGKSAEEFVSMAEHGSDRERLMDALSHFPEFAKEFQCNSSHRLYPHETCHLWR